MLPTIAFGPHLCWGKAGAWGSVGLYCPGIDLAVGLTVNRMRSATPEKLLIDLAKLVDKAWAAPASDEWPLHPFASVPSMGFRGSPAAPTGKPARSRELRKARLEAVPNLRPLAVQNGEIDCVTDVAGPG